MFEKAATFYEISPSGRRAYSSAKSRAKAGEYLLLSRDEFVELWNRAKGQCELSGLNFSDKTEDGVISESYVRKGSYPWQPSVDQIRPGFGYHAENCQLVCKVVNIGKNSYQQETFERWVLATARKITVQEE